MATEAEILEARRKRAQQLAERGESLFPARVPRPLDPLPEILARFGELEASALAQDRPEVQVAGL